MLATDDCRRVVVAGIEGCKAIIITAPEAYRALSVGTVDASLEIAARGA